MSDQTISLCCVYADGRAFGLDTRSVCEVLGQRQVQRVPLTRSFVGGAVTYRGDVLPVVNLRAVLGMEELVAQSFLVAMDGGGKEGDGRYGLMVDAVGEVREFGAETAMTTPATLDAMSRAVFEGAVRTDDGLLVRLDAGRLRPSWLRNSGLFGNEDEKRGRRDANVDCG